MYGAGYPCSALWGYESPATAVGFSDYKEEQPRIGGCSPYFDMNLFNDLGGGACADPGRTGCDHGKGFLHILENINVVNNNTAELFREYTVCAGNCLHIESDPRTDEILKLTLRLTAWKAGRES